MSSKSTSVSQEEIRFLLKDFPCSSLGDEQDTLYKAPFASPVAACDRLVKRKSLARQIRRLFEDSMQLRS